MRQNKLYTGMLLMLLSAAFTATGQALWKLATHGLFSWQLYIGFTCYGIGAMLMTIAFRFGSLSVLHPLLSTGYVFSIIIGMEFLHEHVTIHTVIGDIVVIAGAAFMGLGGRREQVQP
jgi:drug/metabolite transporter (DMT)-like permease